MLDLKKEILIPKNIEITICNSYIKLKGPLKCILLKKNIYIECNYEHHSRKLILTSKNKKKILQKKIFNYYLQVQRSLKTLTFNFFLQLKLVGIGYRFISFKNSILTFRIGFCNIIEFKLPKNVYLTLQKATIITIYSQDLLALKQISTSIKRVRSLDHYKGKGILYLNEIPKLKETNKKQL